MGWQRKALAAAFSVAASLAWAHGDEDHSASQAEQPKIDLEGSVTALPWDVGGSFKLLDHTGATRTEVDPDGRYQLLFFGYAKCPGICSAALPMMGEVADRLASENRPLRPILVTIDPKLDKIETMGPALSVYSQEFVGLTGEPEALAVAYDAYQVSFEHLFDDPQYGPIYSHGSHIYLLDPKGEVLTLLPPVLPPEQTIAIINKYMDAAIN